MYGRIVSLYRREHGPPVTQSRTDYSQWKELEHCADKLKSIDIAAL